MLKNVGESEAHLGHLRVIGFIIASRILVSSLVTL